MRRIVFLITVFAFVLTLGAAQASAGEGLGFGYFFKWFRDADGDGIPNGLDDDWAPPQDGNGYQTKNGFGLITGSTLLEDGGDNNMHRRQYRNGNDQVESPGERLRTRLGTRDGSCP